MTKKRTNNPDRETFKSLLESIEKFTQEDVDYLMEDLDRNWLKYIDSYCLQIIQDPGIFMNLLKNETIEK